MNNKTIEELKTELLDLIERAEDEILLDQYDNSKIFLVRAKNLALVLAKHRKIELKNRMEA